MPPVKLATTNESLLKALGAASKQAIKLPPGMRAVELPKAQVAERPQGWVKGGGGTAPEADAPSGWNRESARARAQTAREPAGEPAPMKEPAALQEGSAAFKKEIPKAKQALDFMKQLNKDPGSAYPAEDYDKLSGPVKSILNTFGRAQNSVRTNATSYGVDDYKGTAGNDVHPAKLEEVLSSELKPFKSDAGDVVKLLNKEAQRTALSPRTRAALKETARLWGARESSPEWQAATSLHPVKPAEAPPPPPGSPSRWAIERATRELSQDVIARDVGGGRVVVYGSDSSTGTLEQTRRLMSREDFIRMRAQELDAGDQRGLDALRDHGFR